jgi:hypothetical protein
MFHLCKTATQILPRRAQVFTSASPLRHVFRLTPLQLRSQLQSRTFLSFLHCTCPNQLTWVHTQKGLKWQPRRSQSSAINAAAPTNSTGAYPQRLLIYYAGKRTVYLGTLKLYTVLLFSYCSLVVAPPLWGQDNLDAIVKIGFGGLEVPRLTGPVAVILGSLVPLIFVQYLRLANFFALSFARIWVCVSEFC